MFALGRIVSPDTQTTIRWNTSAILDYDAIELSEDLSAEMGYTTDNTCLVRAFVFVAVCRCSCIRLLEGAGGLREEEAKLKVPYDSVAFQSKCTDEYQVETLETKCAEEQELFATLSRHTSTGCRCVQRMLR